MEIIDNSIERFYPTKKYSVFMKEIEDTVSQFSVHESSEKEIEQLFKKVQL